MGATASIKRGLLRAALAAAQKDATSLLEALTALESARFTAVSDGRFLTGTTSLGHSVTFSLPSTTDATAQDVHEAADDLLRLYDAAVVALGATTDPEIYGWIMKSIVAVRHVGMSFGGILK